MGRIAYNYMLVNGYIWSDEMQLRMIYAIHCKQELMKKYFDSLWAR